MGDQADRGIWLMREARSLSRATARLLFFFGSLLLSQVSGAHAQTPPIGAVPVIGADIEAPRNVAASNWSSLYCLRWTDGCETCSRDELWSKTTCEPHGRESCMRRAVACEAAELPVLSFACNAYRRGRDCNRCVGLVRSDSDFSHCTRRACTNESDLDFRCLQSYQHFKAQCDSEISNNGDCVCARILRQREASKVSIIQRFRLKELP